MKADTKHPFDARTRAGRHSQRGDARLNLIILLLVIVGVAYVAYKIVPVMYAAYGYKDHMQSTVDMAVANGKNAEWVKEQLSKAAADEYELPPDTEVETGIEEGRMTVRVRWTRAIEFPGYVYEYDFDHSVSSDKFLTPPSS